MAKYETIEKKCEDLAAPIVEEFGFELVDVEYVKEGGEYYLRLYIDKPGGITIDDCEAVSRRYSDVLDEANPINDAYVMEVSSPGLTRPIKKPRDFERNLGKMIEVHTYKPVDGSKLFEGTLLSYNNEKIVIDIDGKEFEFEQKGISLIRPYIEW